MQSKGKANSKLKKTAESIKTVAADAYHISAIGHEVGAVALQAAGQLAETGTYSPDTFLVMAVLHSAIFTRTVVKRIWNSEIK